MTLRGPLPCSFLRVSYPGKHSKTCGQNLLLRGESLSKLKARDEMPRPPSGGDFEKGAASFELQTYQNHAIVNCHGWPKIYRGGVGVRGRRLDRDCA